MSNRIYIFDRSGHIVWTSHRKDVDAMMNDASYVYKGYIDADTKECGGLELSPFLGSNRKLGD